VEHLRRAVARCLEGKPVPETIVQVAMTDLPAICGQSFSASAAGTGGILATSAWI
jgi:hypothetical protein